MPKRHKKVKRSHLHRSLIHSAHSGRLVHHRHTHYPVLVFLMLLCGVLLLAMTAITRAADIQVTAAVMGNPPPYAVVITKPVNGDRFTQTPIDIEGTCPPSSIVKIYRNDTFSGSAICSAGNTFALKSDLFIGQNTLIARVFNFAGAEGPLSDPVVVFYDKPAAEPPVPTPGEPISQLFLDSDILYRGFFTGQQISWPVEIGGGIPPYAVSIDWGDGTSDVISLQKAGGFEITHTYTEPGGYKGSYVIIIKAADSRGDNTYLQLVIIVNDIKNKTTATTAHSDEADMLPFWKNLSRQILLMWPFYSAALLMLLSFWLGERREFNLLNRGRKIRKAH